MLFKKVVPIGGFQLAVVTSVSSEMQVTVGWGLNRWGQCYWMIHLINRAIVLEVKGIK